jgi:hypothetical protein
MVYLFFVIIIIILLCSYKTIEHFNQIEKKKDYDYINWNEIIFKIKNNLETIYFFDKSSIEDFKKYIKKNTKHKYITKQTYFLITKKKNIDYVLEVYNFNKNILLKILLINFKLIDNIFVIESIVIKDDKDLLFSGYDSNENNSFVHPKEFSWQENPHYQYIVNPEKGNEENDNSIDAEFRNLNTSNYIDRLEASKIAKIYRDNRDNYFDLGRCFKSNITNIYDEDSCKKNYGIWDIPCKTNYECPFYVESYNSLKVGRGACLSGYCEFPKGVERVGYKKELKKELNRINKLKFKNKKNPYSELEPDKPICYCEDKNKQSYECCKITENYVF